MLVKEMAYSIGKYKTLRKWMVVKIDLWKPMIPLSGTLLGMPWWSLKFF